MTFAECSERWHLSAVLDMTPTSRWIFFPPRSDLIVMHKKKSWQSIQPFYISDKKNVLLIYSSFQLKKKPWSKLFFTTGKQRCEVQKVPSRGNNLLFNLKYQKHTTSHTYLPLLLVPGPPLWEKPNRPLGVMVPRPLFWLVPPRTPPLPPRPLPDAWKSS